MTSQEIIEKLKDVFALVVRRGVELDSITLSYRLFDDLGFTSIDTLYVAMTLEDELGIRFEGITVNDLVTVGDVVSYIQGAIENPTAI